MDELSTSRHRWSWRSCFASVKHSKKSKKQQNHHSGLKKLSSNGDTHKKRFQTVDENSNILCDFDLSSETTITNEYNNHLKSNLDASPSSNENNLIEDDYIQKPVDDSNSTIINEKTSSIVRPSQLDAIVEDSNEENADEHDETIKPFRLCSDREIINDCNDLHSRLYELSKMNHIIIHFNDTGHLLGEFIRQIGKLKLKIDDIIRTSTDMPRDAELLEARYSALLSTIESLSLLHKIAQISSSRSLLNRLIFSIEQRMEQLNRLIQLPVSINLRQQRQDLNDDDFLSFRSALSSYEHLLTISY